MMHSFLVLKMFVLRIKSLKTVSQNCKYIDDILDLDASIVFIILGLFLQIININHYKSNHHSPHIHWTHRNGPIYYSINTQS